MKKLILTSALALAVTAGTSAPAHAGDTHKGWIELQSYQWPAFTSNPISAMIALLLPAVQSGRG